MKNCFNSEKNIRRFYRSIFLWVLLVCLILLSACGENGTNQTPSQYEITVTASAGTGVYWNCELKPAGIARFTENRTDPEPLTYGGVIQYRYVFTGEHYGETTAVLTYRKPWDDSVKTVKTCKLTVDRDNNITGEDEGTKLYINPGEGYSLDLADGGNVSWIEEDGCFVFTPQMAGKAIATFTKNETGNQNGEKRVFYITVSEAFQIGAEEEILESSSQTFETVADLEKSLGFPMTVPEEAEIREICSISGIGLVSFLWKDVEISLTGGAIDVDEFFTEDGECISVKDVQVGIPLSDVNIAGWEKGGIGYHIVCSGEADRKMLQQLLSEML